MVQFFLLYLIQSLIEDDSEKRILWIKFVEIKQPSDCFYTCVTNLPPHFSTRSLNGYQTDVDGLDNKLVDIIMIMHHEMNNKQKSRINVLKGTNDKRGGDIKKKHNGGIMN